MSIHDLTNEQLLVKASAVFVGVPADAIINVLSKLTRDELIAVIEENE